jgi:hypothetical protein
LPSLPSMVDDGDAGASERSKIVGTMCEG